MSTNNAALFVALLVAAHRLASHAHAHDRYGNNVLFFLTLCQTRRHQGNEERQGCSLRDVATSKIRWNPHNNVFCG